MTRGRPWWRWIGRGDPRPLDSLAADGFVAIDLETTGLDARGDAVVALAAVPFVDGTPRPGYVTLVNPRRPIPPASTRIHGITDAMVAGAPPFGGVAGHVEAACRDAILVGHGVAFDLAVLARERRACGLRPLGNLTLCTQRLAAALHPGWTDLGLDAVAARLGVPVNGRHTARGDAVAAGDILLALLPGIAGRGVHTITDALRLQETASLHRAP